MRRARIKAVVTVPVRRKAQQEAAAAEAPKPTSVTDEPEKPVVENNVEKELVEPSPAPAPAPVEKKQEDKVEDVHKAVPVAAVGSPLKQKEANSDAEVNNEMRPSQRLESPVRAKTPVKTDSPTKVETQTRIEKSPAPSVEGAPVKSIQGRFTRPTPRLDGGGRIRRNSMQGSGASASESEDDSRRSSSAVPSRVRNDSVCSVQSLKDSSNTSAVPTKLNLGQKRRMVVSESARKLAEARREFNLKHENKTPDKSKLTMYDLIYYNPTTNPMKPKPVNQRAAARKISVCSVIEKEKEEEEIVDEPTEMPVPQVKVGPNGELIIDEKSLVIDQYKVQENMNHADVIIDDDNTGNGFYKRRQKSKDWNKWETVKFYKALNTYGTDFLLMQSIFPNRTRQELKLKYKKEERINSALVEKALQYQEFDIEALEKDLASVEENERKESEQAKRKVKKDNSTGKKRRRCKVVNDEITGDALNDKTDKKTDEDNDDQSSDENVRITITKKVRKRKRRKNKLSETVSEKSHNEGGSDSNPEVYKAKPTRSGRVPAKTTRKNIGAKEKKVTRKKSKRQKITENEEEENEEQNNSIETNNTQNEQEEKSDNTGNEQNNEASSKDGDIVVFDKNNVDEEIVEQVEEVAEQPRAKQNEFSIISEVNVSSLNGLSEITDDITSMSNLRPGSLVVLKKDSADEPGKATLQVFIVSDDYDASNPNCKDSLLPVDITPDELQTITSCIQNIPPHTIS